MITVYEAARASGGQVLFGSPKIKIKYFVTDSREAEIGTCFVAIKGKRADGNAFLDDAIKKGVSAILTEVRPMEKKVPVILVESVQTALEKIAEYYRKKRLKTVVAVTGSVGKTTVKELLSSVLSQRIPVLKTDGNKNNLLGLPITILSKNKLKNAVFELGISENGEMERLSKISKPNVAIVTNIGLMHRKTLKSKENTAREKLKIVSGMKKGGTLIINGDERLLVDFETEHKKISVSQKDSAADYYVYNIKTSDKGTCFDVNKKGKEFLKNAFVSIVGAHGALDSGFAVAAADILRLRKKEIYKGLKEYKPCGNRQRLENINGRDVIFDCYNAGPESFRASLEAFEIIAKEKRPAKKGIIAGSMLELGKLSKTEHIKLGKRIAAISPDFLITVGGEAAGIAKGASDFGMQQSKIYTLTDGTDISPAAAFLEKNLCHGALLLIKGSRGVRLERFEDCIKAFGGKN